ncbi:hypothetical protein Bbelb_436180 [Branchiostoma belcheri]|nr:hypothetical protein Bbelb_436180 [Branchiostoma belcheri]
MKVRHPGLNFAVAPNKIPSIDIVTETESAIHRARLPQRQAEALRAKVATTLKVSKPPTSNITREERNALKDLATSEDIVILPADKGRCTVVLDREQYDKKIQDLLGDKDTYSALKKDPTNKFKGKIHDSLKKLEKEGALDRATYLKLNPTSEQPPAFYGLPKVHKQGVPLQPIVSSIGSATYELAGFLAKILGPLVGKSQHHVKNSADFVQKIKDIHIEEDEIITSYDVFSLFTCIPPKEAVSVVREALEADNTLADRTNLSVDQLSKCGYQKWTFNKALKPSDHSKKTRKSKPLTDRNKANITIPYIQGVSEKLRRIFQNFNIATNFKPQSTLRQKLVHPKDKPRKGIKANVIYRLKCEEPSCNSTYIGETSQPLKERYKQHSRPGPNGYSSAIYHHLQQGHSFNLVSMDILDREPRWFERGCDRNEKETELRGACVETSRPQNHKNSSHVMSRTHTPERAA